MANTSKKPAARKAADESKKKVVPVSTPVAAADEAEAAAIAPTPVAAPVSRKLPPVQLDEMIDVQSCVFGQLIWVSRKTGYTVIWNEYGERIPLSVSDLLDMRNGSRAFFERNWVMLEGERAQAIMDYLQVSKFYKSFRSVAELDEIFTYEPEDIEAAVQNLSPSLRENVARRAYALMQDGELDSRKVIDAVERATGFSLSE